MNRLLHYMIIAVCILLLNSCRRKAAMPDLRENYSSRDTKPFGTNIAYRIVDNSFPANYVQVKKQPFEDVVLASPDTSSIYFCITKNFSINPEETDAILDYVYKGNTFFLAADQIDSILLKKIYCKTNNSDRLIFVPGAEETSVRLVDGIGDSPGKYSYYYLPFTNHFTGMNEDYSRVVGYNSNDKSNCIVFFWGKGKMFLHTDPRAFSNYFLLTKNNYKYMKELLQLMNESPQHVYWDDYYRQNRQESDRSFSTMSEIMKSEPLSTAFWLCLLMLLLYILFGMKRRQRIIKEIPPNLNSSVAFTETIARLYLQQHDNKNIAEKMITYFNEHIRNNYFLYNNAGSDDFIETLSRKSGVPLEKTTSLYRAMNHAMQSQVIDDYQLLSLNEQIQQFYKKRK